MINVKTKFFLALVLYGSLFPITLRSQIPVQQLFPDVDEQAVYEIFLPLKDHNYRICPNLEIYGTNDPNTLWINLCHFGRGNRSKRRWVYPFRNAFNDLVGKCHNAIRLTQWNPSIPVHDSGPEDPDEKMLVLRFSPVGFDQQHYLAVVYRGLSCGPDCGSGDYYFLRKKDGHWSVVGNITMWMS